MEENRSPVAEPPGPAESAPPDDGVSRPDWRGKSVDDSEISRPDWRDKPSNDSDISQPEWRGGPLDETPEQPRDETLAAPEPVAYGGLARGLPGLGPLPGDSAKITVQGLMEGAMMTALAVVLAVISTYVPLLNLAAPFVFPVPIALLVLRRGLRLGLVATVAIFFLSSMILSWPVALSLLMMLGGVGLFMGWCFRKRKSALLTLGGNAVLAAVGTVGAFALILYVEGLPIGAIIDQTIETVDALFVQYSNSGMSDVLYGGMTRAEYNAQAEMLLNTLMPGFLVAWSMLMAVICYLVFSKFAKRLGYPVKGLPPFSEWRMSWGFLWLLIVALGSSGLGERFEVTWLTRIGGNLLYICVPIFLAFGISVLAWLFKRWKAGLFLKILLAYLALSMFIFTFYLIIFLGVFDPIIDFRGRMGKWFNRPRDTA